MENDANKRPRPRRTPEAFGQQPTPAQQPAPAQRPTPAQQPTPAQRPTPAQQPTPAQRPTPAKKPTPQKRPAAPKPAAPKPAASVKPMPAGEEDNEKTRLTDAMPKAGLKTPVRGKPAPKETSPSTTNGVFKAIVYMTVVLLVSILLAYAIVVVANDVFAFIKPEGEVEVVIPENASVDDVSEILGDAGVIEYPALFRLYAKLKKESGVDKDGKSVFIPGTYTVSPMENYMQLLDAFKEQYVRGTVWVTFPEGSTVEDIIETLVEAGISDRASIISAINDYDYGLDFVDDIDMSNGRYYRLEGYLFPDTYQFYTDSSAETVIYKMLVNFKRKLAYIGEDMCSERLAELGMTLDEVVTLASMVEKEVKYAVDYETVASVFYNRLADPANFPRLDSDATTVYAIRMATGTRPETLTAEDVEFDSPYNTRVSRGLPPGAIANPGYEALYCAFYPAKTKYYYFVADTTGYNLYARTNAGHEQNKAEVKKHAASAVIAGSEEET